MTHTLFIGTYPGLTEEQIAYIVKVIRDFVAGKAEILKAEPRGANRSEAEMAEP